MRVLVAIALTGLLATATPACGGESAETPESTGTTLTVAQVQEGFAAETGVDLTRVESEYGGPPRLVHDEDGKPTTLSEGEAQVVEEFGSFTIYVAEKGDPDKAFRLLIGKSRERTAPSGDGTLTVIEEVPDEPDGDGVIWKRGCVEYSDDPSLDTCSWTAFKRYGDNALATWTSVTGEMEAASESLDRAMEAATGG